jgi:hypothetical protein
METIRVFSPETGYYNNQRIDDKHEEFEKVPPYKKENVTKKTPTLRLFLG